MVLYLIGMLVYLFTKARKVTHDPNKATTLFAFWDGALRYVIAFDLCVFGLGKFFDIQRHVPQIWLNSPYDSLAPYQIFWAFFGHFYALQCIVGAMEIAGSVMLLFRKTRLVGIVFLLPITLNILLLDSFYLRGTTYYIGMITLGLIYLFLMEYLRLVKFFLVDKSELPRYTFKSPALKTALRLIVVIGAFLLMAAHRYPQYHPDINGKYIVKSLVINNVPKNIGACQDSILTKVFIDKDDFVFEYNNYQRRWIGDYKYNEVTRIVTVTWNYPHAHYETLYAKILPGDGLNTKTLVGRMGKESFTIGMQRVNRGK
jgi:uncharacterized membrane protein